MATNWFERTWKPVKLAGSASKMQGGSATNTSYISYNEFANLMEMSEERKKCLDIFDQMDKTVDIARALDIIAEDISSDNADDDEVFLLDFEDGYVPKKAESRTLNKVLRLWEKKTQLDYRFYDYAREMVKYGAVFFEKAKDGELMKIPIREMVKADLDEKTGEVFVYYREDPVKDDTVTRLKPYKPEDLVIWKRGEDPFGESILERVYRMWRALSLLEEAVVIYRIVRAPERRVFYVDQGGMNEAKSSKHLKQFAAKIKQKLRVKDNKQDADFNPLSMQEDYFIGVKSDGRGSRVETLPGGEQLGEIRDLNHFNKKLAFGLRVPVSWFDTETPREYNDGRLGTQYISELRYVGFVKRLQKIIVKELFSHFKGFSETQEVEVSDEVFMKIALPQSFAIYKQNEMHNALLNTLASAEQMEFISKKVAAEKFLHFDQQEIEENELMKMLELGISEKDIKKLPPHAVANLVYGDRRIMDNLEEFISGENSSKNKELTPTSPGKDLPGEADMDREVDQKNSLE